MKHYDSKRKPLVQLWMLTIKTYRETTIEKQQLNFEELQLVLLVPSAYENQ